MNQQEIPIRYKVTDAARITGVSASTLRLWELQGLIEPERTNSGQRWYTQTHLDQLQRIQRYRLEQGLNPAAIKAALENDADRSATPKHPEPNRVGKRARHLRQTTGRTLADVAAQAGIAVSALSTFERTSHGLSVKVLHDLAAALGTTVSALSGSEEGEARKLIRSGQWSTWPQSIPGVTIQRMAEGANQMDCHRFVLMPGAGSEGAYEHEGEEFLHVLQGSLDIILGQEEFHNLTVGDSLYFKSSTRHAWKNSSDGETILLWINTPPTF